MSNPEYPELGENQSFVGRESLVEFYDPVTGETLPRRKLPDAVVAFTAPQLDTQSAYDGAAAMGHDIEEEHLEG